ncbi:MULTISPECIES: DUF3572 domain-containing protein [Methylobacterium]|uniref:DUF3572 domain-containing protein n=1 Tax=Methylobacterium TaxID=407 RepID=UPI00104D694D|nr:MULTISPECIES: DUF3572 domain-containing protein [Methylobacterium]MDR7038636.1 hypothetical protein [Methylobacterium sp. BE186]
MKRKSVQEDDSAEAVAVAVLGWLAGDEERLYPFLNASGLSADNLRASARDPGFLAGVLDHVMGDEALLLACARDLDRKPETIAAAWQRLSPQAPDAF